MPLRLLALTLMLAGCGAPAPPPAESSPTETPESGSALALDGEGFRIVHSATGSARPLLFGTEAEQAIETLARLRGEPEARSTNPECGAGPLDQVAWSDGLTVYTADGRFVGWHVSTSRSEAALPYTTMAGLGVGSTRADLDAAYAAHVEASTLGTEFEAGGLFGLLSGPEPDATVTDLWAGTGCAFR